MVSSNCSSPYRATTPVGGNAKRVPFNPENVCLRLEPFTETTLAQEKPDCCGIGGGAWVPIQTPPEELFRPSTAPTLESQLPKRLIIAARDKESLLEEVITLKGELNERTRRFMSKRVEVSTAENENRKLEKDIEDLEFERDSRRVDNPTRLRTKLNTMKNTLGNLHMVCEEQRDELFNLRKDVRVTRTRELEVERNVFAEEIVRLLKYMKRLRATQNKLSCENKELNNIKERAVLLEIANKRLETCVLAIDKNLEKTKQETALFKQRALETINANKVDEKRRKELEEAQAKLEAKLDSETIEKDKFLKKIAKLENEVKKLTKDLREAEAAKSKAELTAKALTSPPPPSPPPPAAGGVGGGGGGGGKKGVSSPSAQSPGSEKTKNGKNSKVQKIVKPVSVQVNASPVSVQVGQDISPGEPGVFHSRITEE